MLTQEGSDTWFRSVNDHKILKLILRRSPREVGYWNFVSRKTLNGDQEMVPERQLDKSEWIMELCGAYVDLGCPREKEGWSGSSKLFEAMESRVRKLSRKLGALHLVLYSLRVIIQILCALLCGSSIVSEASLCINMAFKV
ncbi:hypothetical protein RND71_019318 [Anisodus tanguticus]|uniref:Uncharacterized protein n=1 Tax=Anisodus tanguticus TaxID=243964 RepID=A0AAE1S0N7_9SOLA|nr:hypothetical protein RND71_019318 [Anisodus tanguticus]